MKTANTPENKAKFFAENGFNQTVLFYPVVGEIYKQHRGKIIGIGQEYITISGGLQGSISDAVLEKRSLSSITDDEAIEVAKIHRPNDEVLTVKRINKPTPFGHSIEVFFKSGYTFVFYSDYSFSLKYDDVIYEDDYEISIRVYQYLQQQGFALPVYFKGVQYSVEKLTELGIYQITGLKQEVI